MAGAVKTEAVVLRSMRYGEADRILQVYTPNRGRVSAIAKGVRRARSRFGGRLEPFFRLQLDLHEGKGELLTVTGAQTVAGHARLRGDARALDAAARACDAVGRLFETGEPPPGSRRSSARARAAGSASISSASPERPGGWCAARARPGRSRCTRRRTASWPTRSAARSRRLHRRQIRCWG